MLITPRMTSALVAQVGNELSAANQYTASATFLDAQSLPEFAARFHAQSDEERQHALKFVHYLAQAGATVAIPAIPGARTDFATVEEVVALALAWELEVTGQINALVRLALEEGDYLTQGLLQWFVTEQLEEVATMETLLGMTRRAGEGGLLFVEQYLARTGTGASAGTEG